eukprot:CAMPEP_0196571606 /NCGR_PEP_ID=MMETSP1081-20130531/1767_1 /TAXON_ID=36882 /ORGANISM="Pyramimonas amylifera, Strain CCMP720" /LENGTH=100 /DNA_ID=CAMNT_0041888623 /DNA_START=274 /DNA_END=576 /DNA_ORIENTATION=+
MAHAEETATIFQKSCAGCHAGGGNVLNPSRTLSKSDLSSAGLFDADGIYDITYKGKGKMPGYGIGCAPKGACTFAARLDDDTIRSLAEYVKDNAEAGWKK